MSTARKRVEVAAAVIQRPDGQFLLGQRAADTVYAGYWEFPGGKVEAGETPHDALVRELQEELAIEVTAATPWMVRDYEYEHAHVRLHFFFVRSWRGEPQSRIHAALAWQEASHPTVTPMLPANALVLHALKLPAVYAITHAHEIGVAAQLAQLDVALARGVRLVQVREPGLRVAEREAFARAVRDKTRQAGALMLINDDDALARDLGADGLHLPARKLMQLTHRPDFAWVGASCHNADELAWAAQFGLDFVLLGPVMETASHPGLPGIGWAGFSVLREDFTLPVFAIGGLGERDLPHAWAAGAHGVAGIRGIWQPA